MEHSSPDLYEMHAIVKGDVQGVGFRATTRYYAINLGVKGFVRNLKDGTVEIFAQGSKERLEELMKKLQDEAAAGKIDSASIDYFPVETPHQEIDFRIIH